MPTIEQIRAARALLGWNQETLAQQANMSQTGIARIENGTNQPNSSTLQKIRSAFDRADVEFIGNSGVKRRTGEARTLRGLSGFKEFMDDVYEQSAAHGGKVYLFNSKPGLWVEHLGAEWYGMHARRMKELGDQISIRILVSEGEEDVVLDIAEHRTMAGIEWKSKTVYGYGHKIAFLDFKNDVIRITIITSPELKEYFEILFDIAWETAK